MKDVRPWEAYTRRQIELAERIEWQDELPEPSDLDCVFTHMVEDVSETTLHEILAEHLGRKCKGQRQYKDIDEAAAQHDRGVITSMRMWYEVGGRGN